MSQTIGAVLAPALRERPDAPALVARSGVLTYRELDGAANRAAGAMWSLGVRPGDRVAACLPNDLDIVTAFHGAQRIGAIWLGITEAYSRTEQEKLVALSNPRLVLSGPHGKIDGPEVITLAHWRALQANALEAPAVPLDPFAPAAIAFTSGTTGQPKGIVHSQHNLLLPGAVLVATRGWGPDLRKGDSLPMTILNLLVLSTLTTAQARGCAVLLDRRDIGGIAEQIQQHAVTVWNGAPAQVYDLARRPDLDFSGLQELWSGGGDCPDDLRRAVQELHGVAIYSTYGLTEAPTVVSIDPVDGGNRPHASGTVLPHLEVVAHDDAGHPLPPGTAGDLWINARTAGSWAGQYRPPLGQWLEGEVVPPDELDTVVTGDIGTVDPDGWLTVVDRKKLVIVRGGANVYPAEIERVIRLHPAVISVVVFGVPDDRLGERVAALIVSSEELTTGELETLCLEHLAKYKVPDRWARVSSLPSNAMGKVIRSGLAETLETAPPLLGRE